MISFDEFSMTDGSPIYLQIITYLKKGIAAGIIRDGDELPSRRNLSAQLGVNPNTIQKAYHLLEEEGLMVSRTGAKSCMAVDEEKSLEIRKELVEGDIRNMISTVKLLGYTREEFEQIVTKMWTEGKE